MIPQSVKYAVTHKYAWPGGYPMFLVMSDGAALCVDCGKKEYAQIANSTHHNLQDGWKAEAGEINWEDSDLYCDHCGERIESAYAEDTTL